MRGRPKQTRYKQKRLTPADDLAVRKKIVQMISVGCTGDEICAAVPCSKESLYRYYRTDIERGRALFNISLRRMQYESAKRGNVQMQIWLGKQYLDQRDKQDVVSETTTTNVAEQAPTIVFEFVDAKAPQLRDDYNSSAERKHLPAPIVLTPTGTDGSK